MALDTYDNLLVSAADWLLRAGEPELVAKLPECIVLAENEFYTDLRIRELKYTAEAVHNEEYEWLPGDYAEMVSVKIRHKESNGQRMETPVDFKTDKQLLTAAVNNSLAYARYYAIIGKRIRFKPIPAAIDPEAPESEWPLFSLLYYAKDNPLSPANQTNEILGAHPSLYLWATLRQAGLYVRDNPVWTDRWENNYQRLLAKANMDAKSAEFAGPTSRSAPG